MICSKFITFVVTKTTFSLASLSASCCDLLKIHYLCGDKDNQQRHLTSLFALWFAQNSLPLWWQRQHHSFEGVAYGVVICSKFITFVVTKTTYKLEIIELVPLWFAQNSLPLWWQRQPGALEVTSYSRCDLLKIHYLCGDKDNCAVAETKQHPVVICSKFITFVVTKTTQRTHGIMAPWLWFAQNSLPLWWQRQQVAVFNQQEMSCDLLKIHYLCGDKDNQGQ